MSADQKRPPMSIKQQAEFIGGLAQRCVMRDGAVAKETFLSITQGEAEDLRAVADRLFRMAPFEAGIRKLVTGK